MLLLINLNFGCSLKNLYFLIIKANCLSQIRDLRHLININIVKL